MGFSRVSIDFLDPGRLLLLSCIGILIEYLKIVADKWTRLKSKNCTYQFSYELYVTVRVTSAFCLHRCTLLSFSWCRWVCNKNLQIICTYIVQTEVTNLSMCRQNHHIFTRPGKVLKNNSVKAFIERLNRLAHCRRQIRASMSPIVSISVHKQVPTVH